VQFDYPGRPNSEIIVGRFVRRKFALPVLIIGETKKENHRKIGIFEIYTTLGSF